MKALSLTLAFLVPVAVLAAPSAGQSPRTCPDWLDSSTGCAKLDA